MLENPNLTGVFDSKVKIETFETGELFTATRNFAPAVCAALFDR